MDDDHSFFDSNVTGDETWCFQYDPQTNDKAWNGVHQALQGTKKF
jgi:hypothetical protein